MAIKHENFEKLGQFKLLNERLLGLCSACSQIKGDITEAVVVHNFACALRNWIEDKMNETKETRRKSMLNALEKCADWIAKYQECLVATGQELEKRCSNVQEQMREIKTDLGEDEEALEELNRQMGMTVDFLLEEIEKTVGGFPEIELNEEEEEW